MYRLANNAGQIAGHYDSNYTDEMFAVEANRVRVGTLAVTLLDGKSASFHRS